MGATSPCFKTPGHIDPDGAHVAVVSRRTVIKLGLLAFGSGSQASAVEDGQRLQPIFQRRILGESLTMQALQSAQVLRAVGQQAHLQLRSSPQEFVHLSLAVVVPCISWMYGADVILKKIQLQLVGSRIQYCDEALVSCCIRRRLTSACRETCTVEATLGTHQAQSSHDACHHRWREVSRLLTYPRHQVCQHRIKVLLQARARLCHLEKGVNG
mmetsp:Transcript_139793/g.268016  ORF Transcript_139793/g.268016 Transcript_139793/m.268016 type:complete len:213 (+) Transcript_139793:47-685(+)